MLYSEIDAIVLFLDFKVLTSDFLSLDNFFHLLYSDHMQKKEKKRTWIAFFWGGTLYYLYVEWTITFEIFL